MQETNPDAPFPKQAINWILLAGIVLVAFVLRFQYLGQIEHNIDHAVPVSMALELLDEGVFPLVGPPSGFILIHPPLWVYVDALILSITQNLYSIYFVILSLNALAPIFVYLATNKILGNPAALAGALFVAVNPWIVEYSRDAWPPALMPFWTCLLLLLLVKSLNPNNDKRTWAMAGAWIVLSTLTYTTLHGYFVAASFFILCVLFWRRLPKRGLWIGLGVFIVVQVLFITGLVTERERYAARDVTLQSEVVNANLRDDALRHAFRLVSGEDYEVARGQDAPIQDMETRRTLGNIATPILSFLLLLGIVGAIASQFSKIGWSLPVGSGDRTQVKTLSIILLVWFFLPIVTMSFSASLIHPYYQLSGVPAGAILGGWGLGILLRFQTRWTSLVAFLLALAFILLMGVNQARYHQETATIPGTHGLTALPLDEAIRLGETIKQHRREDEVLFADIEPELLHSFALELFPVVQYSDASAQIFPEQGGLLIALYPADQIMPPQEFSERVDQLELADGSVIVIDRIPPASELLIDVENRTPIQGETWVDLLSYDVTREGSDVSVVLYYRIKETDDALDGLTFAPFVHVLNPEGERIMVIDGTPIPGYFWESGDVHRYTLVFDLPESEGVSHTLLTGLYDGVANQGITFITSGGDFTQTIELAQP